MAYGSLERQEAFSGAWGSLVLTTRAMQVLPGAGPPPRLKVPSRKTASSKTTPAVLYKSPLLLTFLLVCLMLLLVPSPVVFRLPTFIVASRVSASSAAASMKTGPMNVIAARGMRDVGGSPSASSSATWGHTRATMAWPRSAEVFATSSGVVPGTLLGVVTASGAVMGTPPAHG